MRLVKVEDRPIDAGPPPSPPREHTPHGRGRAWAIGIATGVLVAGLGTAVDYAVRARWQTPPAVLIAPVTKGGIAGVVRVPGTLAPRSTTVVSQPLAGRIVELLVSVGDTVVRGQTVARFDPLALRAELARAEARLVAAEAAAFEAELRLGRLMRSGSPGPRYEGPFDDGAATDLDDARSVAEARAASSAAELAAREAAYRVARRQLAERVVRAPAAGTVVDVAVAAGATVDVGAPLITIASDVLSLDAVAQLPEAELAKVQPGQEATFTVPAYTGRAFAARVAGIGALHGPHGARTAPVTLTVQNPDRALTVGMSASVAIRTVTTPDVFRVPTAALGFVPRQWAASRDEASLWLADADSARLRRVAVEVGVVGDGFAEVRGADLSEGAGVAVGYGRVEARR